MTRMMSAFALAHAIRASQAAEQNFLRRIERVSRRLLNRPPLLRAEQWTALGFSMLVCRLPPGHGRACESTIPARPTDVHLMTEAFCSNRVPIDPSTVARMYVLVQDERELARWRPTSEERAALK